MMKDILGTYVVYFMALRIRGYYELNVMAISISYWMYLPNRYQKVRQYWQKIWRKPHMAVLAK